VGYLLDTIRRNGEKKELVDEVVTLAKRYGITTPYTSYLIVPDGPVPVAGRNNGKGGKPDVSFHLGNGIGGGFGGAGFMPGATPPALNKPGGGPTSAPVPVADFAKQAQAKAGDGAQTRANLAVTELEKLKRVDAKGDRDILSLKEAQARFYAYNQAKDALSQGKRGEVQAGKLGVDLSCATNELRTQCQLTQNALRRVGTRNCLEVGGVWIDEAYDAKMTTISVKALSPAYFRILERHPEVRDVFRIGNYLVWVTPNGTALAIDASNGREQLTDEEIDRLFVARK
jgi:Ca-activated chloride channel family protein